MRDCAALPCRRKRCHTSSGDGPSALSLGGGIGCAAPACTLQCHDSMLSRPWQMIGCAALSACRCQHLHASGGGPSTPALGGGSGGGR